MFSMEKDIFWTKEEFIPPDQIALLNYVLTLIALITAIIFCFLLFRII